MIAEGLPRPGAILDGKYRLVRQLGAGGMGVVYEADHLRLRQSFAIKILLPELACQLEFLRRFEREARAAALVHGPHVVRVFDVDTSPENLTYMVMELLDGHDLAMEAALGAVSVPQLIAWIVQVCSGLQDAHDAGIVHRDLKPANIFLTKLPGGERVAKVLDFGISKSAATTALSIRTIGAPAALGTPNFMAPEQVRSRAVDARTDVWSLGIVLYHLLSGEWPFSGADDQKYMTSILADRPTPLEAVRPDLPHELAAAIMKAIEKDPAHRYASMTEMAAALAPFGHGRGGVAALPPLRTPATSPLTPAPQTVVMAGAIAPPLDQDEDTVLDAPLTPAGVQTPAERPAASAATAFAPPTPPSSPVAQGRSSMTMLVAAALALGTFAVVGTLVYLRTTKVATTSPPAERAGETEPLPNLLPPAIDLPASPSAPSASGAVADPKSSASPSRRRPRVAPSTSAPASPPAAPPPPASNPTML